jgi:hypothetical protein
VLLLRHGISTQPSQFDFSVAMSAKLLDWPVRWYIPEPGGRDQVFYRDIEMVRDADVVLAFFANGAVMEGGTAHVVEKAQDARVPVYAYEWEVEYGGDNGHFVRVGEHDPDNTWVRRVPEG